MVVELPCVLVAHYLFCVSALFVAVGDMALALPSPSASERVADVSCRCRTSCMCVDMPMFWHIHERGECMCVQVFQDISSLLMGSSPNSLLVTQFSRADTLFTSCLHQTHCESSEKRNRESEKDIVWIFCIHRGISDTLWLMLISFYHLYVIDIKSIT